MSDAETASTDDDPLTGHGKRPFLFVRSVLVAMPLAILVGSIVSPPDPFAQLLMIAAAMAGGLPITYRLVAKRRYGPKQLGAFFGIVLVATVLGMWVFQQTGVGPVPEILVRFGVVLGSLLVADVLVFRVFGLHET